MRISDWSSDVGSSDLAGEGGAQRRVRVRLFAKSRTLTPNPRFAPRPGPAAPALSRTRASGAQAVRPRPASQERGSEPPPAVRKAPLPALTNVGGPDSPHPQVPHGTRSPPRLLETPRRDTGKAPIRAPRSSRGGTHGEPL